ALPSLGRTEDFEDLTTEAEAGFTTSDDIILTAPTVDQEINAHDTDLTGRLSGSLNSSAQLLANVKGVWQTVPVSNGSFDAEIPVSYGDNTIVLLAGVPIGSQSNWYKNSAILIRNIEGTLAATDLLTTLAWNQSNTDVDLYVTDPSGNTAWYSSRTTTTGLALDFDNTSGYGPEHITLTSDTSGEILDGTYTVSVHYYSNHREENSLASGTVTIVVNEGDENQSAETVSFSFSTDNSSNSAPGGSGPDWVYIADVDIVNSIITLR
ncbi:MAG: DUF2135 domain-containing protein, partial [Desulfobacterales bacterium]|nr:DUF2135 domain-containing protein [Desulfobacterales bacterium]